MTVKRSLRRPPEPGVVPKTPDSLGLYLHVPFCLQKCPYCSFYSLSGRLDLSKRFVAAIKQQMQRFEACGELSAQSLATIFFGGGTPTMLPADRLNELLSDCLHLFSCSGEMEISLEVNPATVDAKGLQALRRAGFNRLSIGVQSLNDQELKQIGRMHSAGEAVQTVQLARRAGFTNISMDLMYGLPGQNAQAWEDNLNQALELEPEHLSLYELTIEAGTPFGRRFAEKDLQLPHEDVLLAMMEKNRQLITTAGLLRYEISNYARPGYQCSHNINYWENGPYIGLGPGAVSCPGTTRYTAIADVERFCDLLERERQVWQEEETLEHEARFRETVMMGLRMTRGVSLHALHQRFGIDLATYYGAILDRLRGQELVEIHQGRLRLTDQGLLLANTVMAELV